MIDALFYSQLTVLNRRLPNKIWLEYLLQDRNGLKIQFESKNDKKIDIIFGKAALTCRMTDEGDMLQSSNYWSEEYGDDFFNGLYINQTILHL
ncbi:hypothetical protein ABH966_003052 [Lysinibacillus sp. RC46]